MSETNGFEEWWSAEGDGTSRPYWAARAAWEAQAARLAEVEAERDQAVHRAERRYAAIEEGDRLVAKVKAAHEAAEARAEHAERKLAATMEVVGQHEEAQQEMERQAYRGGWAEATEAAARLAEHYADGMEPLEGGAYSGALGAFAKKLRANAHRKTPERSFSGPLACEAAEAEMPDPADDYESYLEAERADLKTPEPAGLELETAFDGVAMYVDHPTTEQKAALYDHARAALRDVFGSCIATDPVATAAHEYRDAAMACPPIFEGDEQYHALVDAIIPMAAWWSEGESVDHEIPTVDLPEGARWDGDQVVHVDSAGRRRWTSVFQGTIRTQVDGPSRTITVGTPTWAARAVLSRAKDA